MAFAFEKVNIGGPLDDPNYVKFVANILSYKDNVSAPFRQLPMKKCTKADLSKFWALDQSEQGRLKYFLQHDALYCIDWTDETIELWGTEKSGSFASADIMVVPCHFKETAIGGKVDNIPKNCNRDEAALAKYLGGGAVNLVTYYNTKYFEPNQFG